MEIVIGQTGERKDASSSEKVSRLCKLSFASRYQRLCRNYPNVPSIENLSAQLTGENAMFQPYYRGLKVLSGRYRKVKFALQDTLKKSGHGSWCTTVGTIDLFPVNDLGKSNA